MPCCLDLRQREDRVVAKLLVHLSVDEPGENWVDHRHRHTEGKEGSKIGGWIPGWEVPKSWCTQVPDKGQLELTYTSAAAAGCKPNWKLRRDLIMHSLLGTIPS